MLTFVLPGLSPRNRDWAEEVAKNLKVEGDIRPIFWEHWSDPDKTLKPKEKAEDIVDIAGGDKFNLIAKSVGALIAAYVVKVVPQQVNKIILCGIPSTTEARLKIFKEAFANFPADRIICFQNDHDPFKNPAEIKEFMSDVNPKIGVEARPRSDHHYPYYEDFNKFLS